MSFRAHPSIPALHPLSSAPSAFACGVCGHFALHEQLVASAVPEPPRMVCQVCGAHAPLWCAR